MNISIKEIEANDVKKWHENGEIILIDVRERLEYNEEHLARAHLFPLAHFKPEQLPDPAGKKLLFYCQLGRRSITAASKWGVYAGETEVYALKGGLNAWKKAGLPTVSDTVTSGKIEKQTYAFCGVFIILGVFLAYFISPWFIILPIVIAILLILSGVLGHCLFSFLLSMFPWNR